MKKVSSTRVDHVAVTELHAVPEGDNTSLLITVKFMDMQANETLAHGRYADIWSEDTFQALRKLYDCVERDVANHVGSDGEVSEETDGTGTKGGLFKTER